MYFSTDDPTCIKKRAANSRVLNKQTCRSIKETIPAIMKAWYPKLRDELRTCSGKDVCLNKIHTYNSQTSVSAGREGGD
jgi:hypothetical protein